MFSGAKIQRYIITDPLDCLGITAEISNKQYVRKSLCPTEMLWVKLIILFQPKRNKNRNKTGKVKYEMCSGAEISSWPWITVEVFRKFFCSTKRLRVSLTHPPFLVQMFRASKV